jgi:7-cyano-7-deazaguanine tRNA-ribosyltransferase
MLSADFKYEFIDEAGAAKLDDLQKIWSIADYQFGRGVGKLLFSSDVRIVCSKRTKKIRHIYLGQELLATLRPTTGLFVLTVEGAKRLIHKVESLRQWVRVQEDVEPFIAKGRTVFAKHIVDADSEIRPMEEVIVLNIENEVLAVGRALLSGKEMKAFGRGVAVRVRRGVAEKS